MNISRHQDRPAAPNEAFSSQTPPATKHPALSRATDSYAAIHQSFGWKVPKRFNMAQACCGRWAAQAATAKHHAVREHLAGQGLGSSWTFGQLQQDANRLSRVLRSQGVQRGDRVAIAMAASVSTFKPVSTLAEDPAVLIYTSGTTGNPKGALIPHRALIGNLTGFVCSQNWFGFDPFKAEKPSKAVFWSPADWAWTGGLMDALLPSLYFGRPIVAFNGRFSPEVAFEILQSHAVTHTFLFPTALKAMMKAVPEVKGRYRLKLQAMMSAGEAVGDAVFGYCQQQLGVTVNEMFGQTEINYVVGNCARLWPAKPGSMGKGYPGHQVAVINDLGQLCPPGTPGEVAVNRFDVHGQPDPVFFLGYWNNEKATKAKYTGNWCRTGDMAVADEDGYLWYLGRTDDMFKAAGYRIGPGEIENCLVKHPAVTNAAVVPKPDKDRGALVKAYVVMSPDWQSRRPNGPGQTAFDDEVRRELQAHVRGLLAPYEYPKEIEFIDQLPMTTTGKVQRRVLRLQEQAHYEKRGKH